MFQQSEFIMSMLMLALIGVGLLAYRIIQRRKEATQGEWSDLNNMFSDLYHANDSLKQDLHYSAIKLKVMTAVQDTLKTTTENMYQSTSELSDQFNAVTKAFEALQNEVEILKSELKTRGTLTSDDLDDWYESQSDAQMDLFTNNENQ